MSKRQTNTSTLSFFAKEGGKESTKIKEHKQETDFSRPTCSNSASQSTEFDLAEERINLDRSSIASNSIVKILPPSRSNNVDILHVLKNAFRFKKMSHC